MMFLIESIVLCVFFTLTVPLYGLRDPLAMIDSYPPSIVARAEELGLVPRGRKRRAPKVIAAKLAFCLIVAVVLLKILSRGNVRLNFYLFSFLYSFKGNRRHSYREAAVITSIILALPPGHSSVL